MSFKTKEKFCSQQLHVKNGEIITFGLGDP